MGDRWRLVNNVTKAVRAGDNSSDEDSLPRGFERPRKDMRSPAQPRPSRSAHDHYQASSTPGTQYGYQTGYVSSYHQGPSPPPPQSTYNAGSTGQNHNAHQPTGPFPSNPNTLASGHGSHQGHYSSSAQNHSAYDPGLQNSTSYQGYSPQPATSEGHYQQGPPPSHMHPSNGYLQQANGGSYGQEWFGQTPSPQQHNQSAPPSRPGGPPSTYYQGYGGGGPSQEATATAARMCVHGFRYDVSCAYCPPRGWPP